MYARMAKTVGGRRYWESRATDVAEIARRMVRPTRKRSAAVGPAQEADDAESMNIEDPF